MKSECLKLKVVLTDFAKLFCAVCGLSLLLSLIPLGCAYHQWNVQTRTAERNAEAYANQLNIPYTKVSCQNDYSHDGIIDCEIWNNYTRVWFIGCSKYHNGKCNGYD